MLLRNIWTCAIFVATACAVFIEIFPNGVQPGRSYGITYTPADDIPTTFILHEGDSWNLNEIETLTTSATGGEFVWDVDPDLPESTQYALEIRRGDESNYAGPIVLSRRGASASASAGGTAIATRTRSTSDETSTSVPPPQSESSATQPTGTELSSNPSGSRISLPTISLTTGTIEAQTPTSEPSSSLGAGAIAGIGVGAGIGGLLIGAGIIFLLLRLRKQSSRQQRTAVDPRLPEMEDQDHALAGKKWFLRGRWRSELATEERGRELDGRNVHVVGGPPPELHVGGIGKWDR